MTKAQVLRLVNRWIGVSGGYLGDFSYSSHEAFYPEYCDLDLDVYASGGGTTRERFISTLQAQPPRAQAKIIRGILEKYPVGSTERRDQKLEAEFLDLAQRLDDETGVPPPPPIEPRSVVVRRALDDARALIASNGAASAVDRVHTVLHGYLREVASDAELEMVVDASAPQILGVLMREHPRIAGLGTRPEETRKILRSLAGAVDALGTARNLATPSHPNPALLEEPEAQLAISAAYAVVNYIEARLR
jgi:hypothetical protein